MFTQSSTVWNQPVENQINQIPKMYLRYEFIKNNIKKIIVNRNCSSCVYKAI